MAVLQEYKCPCCGGAIQFDSASQNMKCPYCDAEFDPESLASYDEVVGNDEADEYHWENQAGGEWADGETDGLRTYI